LRARLYSRPPWRTSPPPGSLDAGRRARPALSACQAAETPSYVGSAFASHGEAQGDCIRRGQRTSTTSRDRGALRTIATAARVVGGSYQQVGRGPPDAGINIRNSINADSFANGYRFDQSEVLLRRDPTNEPIIAAADHRRPASEKDGLARWLADTGYNLNDCQKVSTHVAVHFVVGAKQPNRSGGF
jgi:hypothetical protein